MVTHQLLTTPTGFLTFPVRILTFPRPMPHNANWLPMTAHTLHTISLCAVAEKLLNTPLLSSGVFAQHTVHSHTVCHSSHITLTQCDSTTHMQC